MRNRLVLIALFSISLCGAGPAAEAADSPPVTLYERVRGSVAHLGWAGMQGDQAAIQWLGTAFLVDDRCTLATAKHVIDGVKDDQLIVRFQDKDGETAKTFSARLLSQDDVSDLAFLKFGPERSPQSFCGKKNWSPLRIARSGERRALTGEEIRIFGFPAIEGAPPRDLPVLRGGIVASAELSWRGQPMLLLDLTGIPGYSGGPVVLHPSGEVIGVVFGPGRTERVYDLEWATPLTPADLIKATVESRR